MESTIEQYLPLSHIMNVIECLREGECAYLRITDEMKLIVDKESGGLGFTIINSHTNKRIRSSLLWFHINPDNVSLIIDDMVYGMFPLPH